MNQSYDTTFAKFIQIWRDDKRSKTWNRSKAKKENSEKTDRRTETRLSGGRSSRRPRRGQFRSRRRRRRHLTERTA